GRRFAAVTARFDVEGDRLAVLQAGQPGALQRGDVDEHVLLAAFRGDETITFGLVEPFHGALGHRDVSCRGAARGSAAAWRSQLWSRLCRWSETGREITSQSVL